MSPLDTSVLLYAFSPAINGNLPDSLQSITLTNFGLADTADLAPLELWKDLNADEVWQSSDQFLGLFSYAGSQWTIGSLDLLVDTTSTTLFVLADVFGTATQGRTFRGEIPINGCQYSSGNDGPLDSPLTAKHDITISTSGIQVSILPMNSSFSVGQPITVSLSVTNLLGGPIDSVFGEVVGLADSLLVTFDSSNLGPVTLAPGGSTVFDFYYTANQIGVESWQLRAVAPNIPDSSAIVQTDIIQIQAPPAVVTVQLVNSIPTAVIRGQTNVFPLSIRYDHPDTASTAAGLRLDSLRLRIEDGSGNAIAASSVVSRIAILSSSTILTELTSLPSQPDVNLIFNQPVILSSGEQQSYTLLIDIDTAATAGNFALAVENASAVPLVDENTLQPISLDPGITFPLRTASSRIDDPAKELAFSATSILTTNVNYGQRDVATMQLNIRHPGSPGSSQIQLTSLSFSFLDSLAGSILLSDLFDEIKILRQQVTIGELSLNSFDTTVATLPLSLPLTLGPGEIDSLQITVSVRPASLLTGFSLLISDSTQMVVRDLSSGSLLEAVTDTISLATGSLFPINSGWAVLKQPATAPDFCIASILPGSITGGTDSLGLLTLSFNYPVTSDQSPLKLFSVLVSVQDTLNSPLDPERLFDRIGFKTSTLSLTYQPFVELQSGAALFKFSDTGLLVFPGDSIEIQLYADIEADAPFDHFVLEVTSEIDLKISDATDSSNFLGLIPTAGCITTFPFATNFTEIFLPAGIPSLSVTNFPTQIAFRGQLGVNIFAASLNYAGTNPQGDIVISELTGIVQRRTSGGLIPVNGATVFGAIHLQIDNQSIASDTSLVGDTIRLTIPNGYFLSPGDSRLIDLSADILPNASPGNYVIKFQDSTFLDLADENLATALFTSLVNVSYPIFTVELSITEANLEESFSNYPNPFNPSLVEFTTFAYVLSEAAQVDIDVYSITGVAVKRVTINATRGAGPHQEDFWYGVNDKGLAVIPGTYYCRITVRYNSGRAEVFRRKAAVVR